MSEKKEYYPGISYKELSDYMQDNHNVVLIESEMQELIRFIHENYTHPLALKRGPIWIKMNERLPLHKAFWNIEEGYKKDCSFPVRIDDHKYGMAELFDERKEGDPDPVYCLSVKGDLFNFFEKDFHRFEWLDEPEK